MTTFELRISYALFALKIIVQLNTYCMKKILQLFALVGVLFSSSLLYAQDRTVSGNVTSSDDGSPIPGANVLIKGTTNGTVTDIDGNYKLTVPSGEVTIVISFIGYGSSDIEIGNRTVIDVALETDITELSEVVVTAIGIEQNKRTLGYSLQNVDSDEIVNARESNIVNSLAGKVAGVQINSSGGQAGSSSRITIRGNSSLLGSNQPLFVIDGVPIDNRQTSGTPPAIESGLFNGSSSNRAIDIDPNTVEDVTVLKGTAATVLYGSRGANGVILITTKSGAVGSKKGVPTISVSSTFGIDKPIVKGFQHDYLQGAGENYRNGLPAGQGGYRSPDPLTNPNGFTATQTSASWGPHKDEVDQITLDSIGRPQIYDPRNEFYRNGNTWENNVSLNGRSEKMGYLVSFSNLDQDGITPGNEFNRISFLAKVDADLSDKIKYVGSVNYINSFNSRLTEGNGQRSYLYALNYWPISHDINKYYTEDGTYYSYHPTAFNNPFWLAENNARNSTTNRYIINQSLSYQVLPWLSISNRFGIDSYTDLQEDEVNIGTRGAPNGRMFTSNIANSQINNDFIISAERNLTEDLTLTAFVGNNINARTFKQDIIRGIDLNIPDFFDISNASTVEAYEFDEQIRSYSAYFSVGFDYKNMIFLNASGRNDWSSTLPKEKNTFFYPAASLGFVFTDLIDVGFFQYGKVRASWAQAGNTALPYKTAQTFTQSAPGDGTRGAITVPTQGQNAFEETNILANNGLTHELVTEIEVGGDLRFFNNRIGIDIAYYNRVSSNQIVDAPVSPSTGYVSATKNVGEVINEGLELTLTGTPLRLNSGLEWNVQLNFARNRTSVNELTEGVESIFLYGFTSPQIRADVENGYGTIWGSKFTRTEDGQLLIGANGLPIQDTELGSIGNVMPDWTGGLRNTFTFKGISLSALFDMRKGGQVMNFDLYYSSYYGTAEVTADRGAVIVWDGVIDNGDGTFRANDIPVVKDQAYYQNFYSGSAYELFVEDASFIKLRELSLSYSLPKSIINKTPFQSVDFSVIGRNLWIKSNFSYWDPEGSLGGNGNGQGFYHMVTPGTQSLSFGLKVSL